MIIKKHKVGDYDFSIVYNPAWEESSIEDFFSEEVREKFKGKPVMGITTGPILTVPNDEEWFRFTGIKPTENDI